MSGVDSGKEPGANRSNVTFLVAHPDDVAHSMSGTAFLLKEKFIKTKQNRKYNSGL